MKRFFSILFATIMLIAVAVAEQVPSATLDQITSITNDFSEDGLVIAALPNEEASAEIVAAKDSRVAELGDSVFEAIILTVSGYQDSMEDVSARFTFPTAFTADQVLKMIIGDGNQEYVLDTTVVENGDLVVKIPGSLLKNMESAEVYAIVIDNVAKN